MLERQLYSNRPKRPSIITQAPTETLYLSGVVDSYKWASITE
ncbi:hypothetical protein OCD90_17850 [Bacillus pacificus]|nr:MULTISPECIES: hypothetical protein [Bacillus cereus group]MCU5005261.1 hypothetical protein [Bacillus pacificus]MCU5257612.1 hypothetical protein [Bacillus pacificus]MCU5559324.1 hypothetical protein [Bacillus pacificus]MDA2137848.1 hypothetical protein [Bacillus cereus group sp. Bc256]